MTTPKRGTPRLRRLLALAILALGAAGAAPRLATPMPPARPGRPLDPVRGPGVTHPERPIFKLHDDGYPILSEAGFVQLADDGPGFYYGARVPDLIDYARSRGILNTNNWGDPEAMCYASRVVSTWRSAHPDGPRLGIDEISSRYAGFPDYDGDGVSDHKTHQTGMNVNFHVPCPVTPERHIHLGVRNEELYEPTLFRELIDVLVDVGAFRMTTSAGLRPIEESEDLPPTRHRWQLIKKSPDGYSTTWALADDSSPVRLYLLANPSDHGDHVNVLLWRPE